MNTNQKDLSLHQLLLRRLLWPLIPILLIGVTLSYGLARHAAVTAYDAGILDDVNDLAKQVEVREGHLYLELPTAAAQMLAFNNEDAVVYAVWDDNGELISGDPQLKAEIGGDLHEKFRDMQLMEKLYRCVVISETLQNQHFFIAVAQAVKARTSLVREVFLSMLILGGLLVILTVSIVVNAVRLGLRPVEKLRDAIAERSQRDLRPIAETSAPPELLPIIHGTNELLQKLSTSFDAYRRFVADAAHQLRTPLAALGSQIELNLTHPPADNAALLKELLTTTRRTSHLANQLLSLARLEHTDKAVIESREFDFRELIQEAASAFVMSAARKSVEFDFAVDVKMMRGSALLLRELLSNLLDNAVRYAPTHSVIHVVARRSDHSIILQIRDEGSGVPPTELKNLGTAFHKLPTSSPQGCGLGLAIVREIAHLHGGDVVFSNGTDGVGLFVTVTLAQVVTLV